MMCILLEYFPSKTLVSIPAGLSLLLWIDWGGNAMSGQHAVLIHESPADSCYFSWDSC